MAYWIWRFGEFEAWHNTLVHSRRKEYGAAEPVVWKVSGPDCGARFWKEFSTEGGEVRLYVNGSFRVRLWDAEGKNVSVPHENVFTLKSGTYRMSVTVFANTGFPCLYMEGAVETGEGWMADDMSNDKTPAVYNACFDNPEKTPLVFPFAYEKLPAPAKKNVPGGIVFDFGRETFARTRFLYKEDGRHVIRFGESYEEVMDPVWCVTRGIKESKNGLVTMDAVAFRYIFTDTEDVSVEAEYEYLPLPYLGSFRCDDETINRVWDVAAYTFHLNTREFYLDGIKRDRWVWSADAYQSFFVNRYLFRDRDSEARTLIALGGKQPVKGYINTIMDYSYFWLISLMDHYETFGDMEFIRGIYPQAKATMDFCLSRVSEDGFIRGIEGDWVFIDWAPMDKTGALCGEQILLAKAMERFADLCELTEHGENGLRERAKKLQAVITEKFFDAEKQAFIDSYESGKRVVTRQSNLLAYLFLPMSGEMKKAIYEHVVLNPDVRAITTPYFKFYENQVVCEAGDGKALETCLREYYGSMLKTGATTLYEEYDPTKSGAEHYAMYGHPYQKSLCHAWSASPIYLLGRYRAGVRYDKDGFTVSPNLGGMKNFICTVPVMGGTASVEMDEHSVKVRSDVKGGKLIFRGIEREIPAGETVEIAY